MRIVAASRQNAGYDGADVLARFTGDRSIRPVIEMRPTGDEASTGLPSLDGVIRGVLPGDNIVWQVDTIDDYAIFVDPFTAAARAAGKTLVYFRFARHRELIAAERVTTLCRLSADLGFESFTAEIHRVIEQAGRGAFYVFDCLSDLAADWCSDLMLANFFMVTCPYLYDLETVTYFALQRDSHAIDTVAAIRGTTQLLVDVFRAGAQLYIHPLKVDQRYSSTMYLPHASVDGGFRPLTESATLSEVLARTAERRVDAASRPLDLWEHTFREAREILDATGADRPPPAGAAAVVSHLLRMMVTRDERLLPLAQRFLDLPTLLAVRQRMIGTGLIGGKSVGMLLARAILCAADARWRDRLEIHDSFFVGSDVFYTYLVRNDCWRIRRQQRNPASFLDGAEDAQRRIRAGTFPSFIVEQFVAMLEYFGQSPIIVRSSSLLEDGFGNAFTGKYESVFCPNRGAPEERLAAFLAAVRSIYASTMSRDALLYRARRGLLGSDEQMAILVQRVSGGVHAHLFFPQIAGVGLSYNPYVWSPDIDPEAGVLRLVFGLGTRAVDRSDDDYTRVVALNAPLRRPEVGADEVAEFAQHRVDVLNLEANRHEPLQSDEVIAASPDLPIELFASRRPPASYGADARVGDGPWVLTFERLLTATPYVRDMRDLLKTLRDAYDYPVDVEFTANFLPDGGYRINVVQCRPLQVKEGGSIVPLPADLAADNVVLEATGTIIGRSSCATIDRFIFVVPSAYAALPISDRFSVARLIGRLTHVDPANAQDTTVMLLGPGRWGTSTPSLGVPVSFAEINRVSILCEIVSMGDQLVPDVSLGTHFFNDLVEANMLYMALYPTRAGNRLDERFFFARENQLPRLLPDDAEWAPVVRVVDVLADSNERRVYINANCLTQRAVCYLAPPLATPPACGR